MKKTKPGKPVIFKPKNNLKFPNQHVGDTFREQIDLWGKAGYVTIKESDDPLVWMDAVGDILLYDRPDLSWLPDNVTYKLGLFANPDAPPRNVGNETLLNASNWIFWGRHPEILEAYAKNTQLTYEQRPFESIFVGNIENQVQAKFRDPGVWSSVITRFELTNSNSHKYTQREYLQLMQRSRFGLCLRGFGPKCNREIELMALGVVPLVTEDVSLNYFDPLIEGLHYLRIDSPSDVPELIKSVTKDQWNAMSKACTEWYWRNASTKGSFETTMRIVKRWKPENQRVQSLSTMATIGAWDDLNLLLESVTIFNPQLPVYIATDDETVEKLMSSKFKDTLTLRIVPCLNEYTGKNRQQMEKEGVWLEFMLRKCDSIDVALLDCDNTLFVDSDTVLTNCIQNGDFDYTKDVGRSYHAIKKYNEDKYGKYNGGCVFVNHTAFTMWWKLASLDSRYFEQACLEDADMFFSTFDIPEQYNYGWWRLFECPEGEFEVRKNLFQVGSDETVGTVTYDTVTYDTKPLQSIHTHFKGPGADFVHTKNFNQFILQLFNHENVHKNPQLVQLRNALPENALPGRTSDTDRASVTGSTGDVSDSSESADFSKNIEDTQLYLIFQYCNTSDEQRQKEYDYCVRANLNNPKIAALYNMKEERTQVPDFLSKHPKYREVPLNRWLRYKDAFEFANKNLIGKTVALCNLDIFFDPTSAWESVPKLITDNNLVFCLSRFEFDGVSKAARDPVLQRIAGYANCQDAWIWQSPIFVSYKNCDFEIGRPGCDNAIAHRVHVAGYLPWNPSNDFRIFHYDICRGKTGANYLQKTYEEEDRKNTNVFPEEDGYRLVPIKDAIQSIDQLIRGLPAIDEYKKYNYICQILSENMLINNRPQ